MSCLSNVQLEVEEWEKTPLSSSTGNNGQDWGNFLKTALPQVGELLLIQPDMFFLKGRQYG
jgi:hypothetical protein